jgi:hypothetical protein
MEYWLIVVFLAAYAALYANYSFQVETEWKEVFTHPCPQSEGHCNSQATVMTALTTFSEYKVWNTFVSEIHSYGHDNLRRGDDLELIVRIRDPITKSMTTLQLPFKMGIRTDNQLCWHYQMVPQYLQSYFLFTNRCMYLRTSFNPVTMNETVRIKHVDENVGPLAPLVKALYYSSIYDGFEQMTSDLSAHLHQKSKLELK